VNTIANYSYHCKNCGEIELDLKLGTAKETEICPKCNEEVKRIYSPVGNLWKVSGAYGKSSK
jgi:putative FmdB family regulatory protein